MSCVYNAYLPHEEPHEKIPEDSPPGFDSIFSFSRNSPLSGQSGFLGKLDTGDLLLFLLVYLLLKKDTGNDTLLLVVLAALLLLDSS